MCFSLFNRIKNEAQNVEEKSPALLLLGIMMDIFVSMNMFLLLFNTFKRNGKYLF